MTEVERILERLDKLDAIEDRVKAIDVAVRGDKQLGLVGIAENVATLKKDFLEHKEHDTLEFEKVNTQFSKAKGWFAGIMFLGGCIWGVVQLVTSLKS